MKKLLLVLITVLASFLCSAQFNIYHPFPTSNAWWSEGTESYDGTCYINTFFDYYISNDTTVNGKTYHVVHTSGGSSFSDCSGLYTFYWQSFDSVFTAIREDTAKHIYMLLDSKDTLLYDFNLHVGDTLPNTAINKKSNEFYIAAIDSILIGTKYRKRFSIRDTGVLARPFDYFIEGIGSTEGLFERIQVPFEFSSSLECFKLNDTFVYPSLGSGCQLFVLGTPPAKQSPIDISIFPNPSNGLFTLSCHSERSEESQSILSVYNVLGQNILTETLHSTQGDNTINLTNQPNGVYLYRVVDENNNLVGEGKLIIQK